MFSLHGRFQPVPEGSRAISARRGGNGGCHWVASALGEDDAWYGGHRCCAHPSSFAPIAFWVSGTTLQEASTSNHHCGRPDIQTHHARQAEARAVGGRTERWLLYGGRISILQHLAMGSRCSEGQSCGRESGGWVGDGVGDDMEWGAAGWRSVVGLPPARKTCEPLRRVGAVRCRPSRLGGALHLREWHQALGPAAGTARAAVLRLWSSTRGKHSEQY